MNPGPATSTLSSRSRHPSCREPAIRAAMSRGGIEKARASCMATLLARSPWSARLGRSSSKDRASGSSFPHSSAVLRAAERRACTSAASAAFNLEKFSSILIVPPKVQRFN